MKLDPSPAHEPVLVAYEIVNDETGEVASRAGVLGLTDRARDRLYDAMLRKIDLSRFHIREAYE